MAKDLSKFRIEGTETFLAKNRLVLSCLKQFFLDVKVNDYNDIIVGWPDEVQGNLGIIKNIEEITNERYYFMDDALTAADGNKFVVCNQWGAENFDRFVQLATKMGYPIENNQSKENNIDNETKNVQKNRLCIEITGLSLQILQGTCEDNEDTDFLEENPYDGIHVNFFKFDSDNTLKVILDDKVIYEKEISHLNLNDVINSEDVSWGNNNELEDIYNNLLNDEKFLAKNEHGEFNISLQPDQNIFIYEGNADRSKFAANYPEINQRYALIDYGWYHLKSYPIEVTNFKLSDLIFLKDSNLLDFCGSEDTEEVYYAFSHIFHKSGSLIDFEIIENRSKSLDVIQAWIQDV
jgi:hypothetical protein